MNLLEGALDDGAFVCAGGRVPTAVSGSRARRHRRPPPRGLPHRPPPARGRSQARVYAIELIGDHTLVTCPGRRRDDDR